MEIRNFSAVSISRLLFASILCMSEVPKLLLLVEGSETNAINGVDELMPANRTHSESDRGEDQGKQGDCQLLDTVVNVPDPDNPSLFIFPKCVKIKKCRGCCPSEQMSCQPTATKVRNVEVVHFGYVETKQQIVRNVTFSVEEHLGCACDCKTKPWNCSDEQEYDRRICECLCKNKKGVIHCTNYYKIWDKRSCQCMCRNVKECQRGYKFDQASCRCRYIISNPYQ